MVRKAFYLFLFGLIFLIPGPLLSLGLGDIDVDSALNQPLQANIYLVSARPEELEEMRVELAPPDVFDRVGVPRPYFLTQLKFEPVSLSDGRAAIKVTSKDPVREPFLTFLVEVTWPKGRLLREYTVLLDPPEFAQKQAPQVTAPATTQPEPVVEEAKVEVEEAPVPQVAATTEEETSVQQEEVVKQEEVVQQEEPAAMDAIEEDIDELRAKMDRALGIDHSEPVVEEESTEVAQQQALDTEPTAEELEEAVVKETEETASEDEVVIVEEDVEAEEVAATEEIPMDETGVIVEDEYTTISGDTLSEIAKATRGTEFVTVNQMMIAIQQANPDAFIQNNINLLKTGVVLRIPDEAPEQLFTKEQATTEVSRQNSLWREYREQVSEKMVATHVDAPDLVEEQETSSELATEAEETLQESAQEPAEPKQDLNIMASEEAIESSSATQVAGGEDVQKLQQELVLSKELVQSRDKENEELKSRVEALESMLEKKDKILNIQNQQLNELKQQLSTETEKAEAAEKALQEQSTSEPAVESKQAEPEPQAKSEEIKPPKVEPLPDFEEPSLADETILKPKLQPLPDWEALPEIEPVTEPTETQVAEAQPEETPEVTQEEPVAEVEEPIEPATSVQETAETGLVASVMGSVKQNWTMFAAGLGVIAILLGLMSIRRRRSAQRIQTIGMGMPEQLDDDQFDDILDETIITPQDAPVKAVEPTEETFEPTSDFDAESIAESTESADTDASAGEASPDDILEEADVYISYGLHQQAQDLLTEAIANDPNRNDYKVKLAEVFYSQKDQQSFEQHVQSVKAQLGESSSEWQKIVAMGKELSPANEEFAGGDTVESEAIDTELQSGADQTLTDEDLEDTVVDNRDKQKEEDLEFDADTLASGSFEDDPVASKIMAANENSDILEFEADDLEIDQEDTVGMDTDIQATATGLHAATGLHETSDMNELTEELTEELDEVSMQTTMEDLKPLDAEEDYSRDTLSLQADDETSAGMDTETTPADPDATAAYADADETEQFDAAGIDTEFLDPSQQTVTQTATDLQELGPPSLIEEVGTKLDLAKAFVDMGDSDAAKETLLEVINEGDESQIKAAKDLMDKLGG